MPVAGERVLLLASMVQTWGMVGGLLHGLQAGTTLVLPPTMQPGDLLRAAGLANVIFGVPAYFDLLCRVTEPSRLPGLRLVVSAGERMDPAILDRFEQLYGLRIVQVYGTTEVGLIACDLQGRCALPAVGRPAPGVEVECAARKLRQPHQVALTAPRWPLDGIA